MPSKNIKKKVNPDPHSLYGYNQKGQAHADIPDSNDIRIHHTDTSYMNTSRFSKKGEYLLATDTDSDIKWQA